MVLPNHSIFFVHYSGVLSSFAIHQIVRIRVYNRTAVFECLKENPCKLEKSFEISRPGGDPIWDHALPDQIFLKTFQIQVALPILGSNVLVSLKSVKN